MKLAVPVAVLAGLVLTAPIAVAQEPADCAAAIVALNSADAAHRDAAAADKAAADATDADNALERAEDNLTDAEEDLRVAEADVTAKQAERDRLQAALDAEPPTATQAQVDNAEAALLDAIENRDDVREARDDALDARNDARELADDTDADDLQDRADETDAVALTTALDEARADFDRLCGGVTTTPPVPDTDVDCGEVSDDEAQRILDADKSDPNRLDVDGDGVACEDEVDLTPPAVDVNVVVPSGGVATGGGPA